MKETNNQKTSFQVPSTELIKRVTQLIESKFNTPITTVKVRGNSILFNTLSHICRIKSEVTKKKDAQHTKNCIYYVLFGNSAVLSQSCFNNTYCFDIKNNKHRTYKLGTIRNAEIVAMLIDWCDKNGWEWNGDLDFIIPDKWMGE